MIPFASAIIVGGSASVLAVAAVSLRHGRSAGRPAIVSCPHCHQEFGGDNLRDAAKITYRWLTAPHRPAARSNLPHSTFLAACPHCAAEFEFTPDGTVFEPPQTGVLSYVRTGRLGITPALKKAAA